MEELEKELLKGERRELCRLHAIRLMELDRKATRTDLALYGNGDPKKGILWIATQNKQTMDWIAKLCLGTLVIVGGNLLVKSIPLVAGFFAHLK